MKEASFLSACCDAPRVTYGSVESLYYTPAAPRTLYVNYVRIKGKVSQAAERASRKRAEKNLQGLATRGLLAKTLPVECKGRGQTVLTMNSECGSGDNHGGKEGENAYLSPAGP